MTVWHENGSTERRQPSRAERARRRLAVLSGGACALAGITVAAWPRVTLALAATLLGVHLTAHGGYRVVDALAARGAPAANRLLVVVIGSASALVGVVCLADVTGTVTALGALLATFWVGAAARRLIPDAERRPGRWHGRRAMDDVPTALMTVVSVLSGFVVLTLPSGSTTAQTMVLGLWLVALGTLAAFDGLRGADRTRADRSTDREPG